MGRLERRAARTLLRLNTDPIFAARWEGLRQHLWDAHRLRLRYDSALARDYAAERLLDAEATPPQLARDVAERAFLFDFTPYRRLCKRRMREYARFIRSARGLSWRAAWHETRIVLRPVLRDEALRAVGGYPPTWPWTEGVEEL